MTVHEAFLEQDLLDLQNKVDEKDKRIAELEKENEKLKKRCDSYEMRLSKMEKGTCDVCKENEKDKRLEELEKENKSLTKELSHEQAKIVSRAKDLLAKLKGVEGGRYKNDSTNC